MNACTYVQIHFEEVNMTHYRESLGLPLWDVHSVRYVQVQASHRKRLSRFRSGLRSLAWIGRWMIQLRMESWSRDCFQRNGLSPPRECRTMNTSARSCFGTEWTRSYSGQDQVRRLQDQHPSGGWKPWQVGNGKVFLPSHGKNFTIFSVSSF